jgi:hypothetical protein
MLSAICRICFFEWVRALRLFGFSLRTEAMVMARGADIGFSIQRERSPNIINFAANASRGSQV